MRNDPKGSIWRQWDFHFHTPASYDYGNKSLTDEEIVSSLIEAGLSAVAVTDHHCIDVSRIKNLQRIAADRLAFFPGIELRCELGGKTSVHYIGIFPENCDIDQLWTNLQGLLSLHPNDVKANGGDDGFYVPFTKGAEVIKNLGGLISIHAGRKSNSIEEICGAEEFKRQVKTDMLKEYVDFLEVGRAEDVTAYRNIVFPAIGKELPIIIGSDNHDAKKYSRKATCWLKADVTFSGLRHILHEPINRICLDDTPIANKRVLENKTKYIASVSAKKVTASSLLESWFDSRIPLNSGLVAIIGNKGSGKSALADILGLLGDSQNGKHFSFLHSDRFKQPKNNKAKHFEATIEWCSGGVSTRVLDHEVLEGTVESVRYLPQSYLETICDTFDDPNEGAFAAELKSVIFSHVAEQDRLGCVVLDDVLAYKTSEVTRAIQLLHNRLDEAVGEVSALEVQASQVHKSTVQNKLEAKRRERDSHTSAPIKVVCKPDLSPEDQKISAAIEQQINENIEEHSRQMAELDRSTKISAKCSRGIADADLLLARVQTLKLQFEQFQNASKDECARLEVDLEGIVSLVVKTESIIAKRTALILEKDGADKELDESNPNSAKSKTKSLIVSQSDLRKKLDRPNQIYQQYLNDQAAWEAKLIAIDGNTGTPDSIKYLEYELNELDAIPAKLDTAYHKCLTISLQIYEHKLSMADIYRLYYKPVQKFIEQHPLAEKNFQLSFVAEITETDFSHNLLQFINHSKKGSFCGVAEGKERAQQLCVSADLNSAIGIKSFLESISHCLRNDVREPAPLRMQVQDQLAKNKTVHSIMQYVFSLDYLKPTYSLQWAGKEIKELSPGERGTLLLVFYLLIDLSDIPLIIDQPEENLDNQTVYDILVPSIKQAKEKRQIIIVTHNPNLAVVCDADQVICANMNKSCGNQVTYECGSIENLELNRRVVDVLEGTWPAFDNRGKKYVNQV